MISIFMREEVQDRVFFLGGGERGGEGGREREEGHRER